MVRENVKQEASPRLVGEPGEGGIRANFVLAFFDLVAAFSFWENKCLVCHCQVVDKQVIEIIGGIGTSLGYPYAERISSLTTIIMDSKAPKKPTNPIQENKKAPEAKASAHKNSAQKKGNNKQMYLFIGAGVAILLVLVSIFVYNQMKVKEYNKKNMALMEQNQLQDSLLNEFMGTFNEFEQNIALIKEREGLISTQAGDAELRKSGTAQISDDLQAIDQLLQRNHEIIDELTAKLETAESNNRPLRNTLARLRKQLKSKEEEVTTLTGQLASLNIQLDSLNLQIVQLGEITDTLQAQNEQLTARLSEQGEILAEQEEEINIKTDRLNTAYYIAGTAKELKDKNIIDRGLFTGKRLKQDFNKGAFTEIDITETSVIPLASKKAEILTFHPSDSYSLEDVDEDRQLDELEIEDPQSFWRSSKYLVVVLN